MPAFEYRALNARGKKIRGLQDGDSARQVRTLLRDMGLTPMDVNPIGQSPANAKGAGGDIGMNWVERALLIRQLATLLRAGMPVEQAIAAAGRQTEKRRVKRILSGIRARVAEGQSLSAAMEAFPRAFPDMIRAGIGAAEESGTLDEVLERLADYAEQQQRLRREVGMALLYPAILTGIALAIVVGLMTYVVPRIAHVFAHTDQALPALTVGLMELSDVLRAYGPTALLVMGPAYLIGRRLPSPRGTSRAWDALKLRSPLMGGFSRKLNAARLTRALSTLVGSGVPVLKAMGIASRVLDNQALREACTRATQSIREGGALHQAFRNENLAPPLTVELIAAGEAGGDLPRMLERAADQLETELAIRVQTAVKLFEPLLVLIMGVLVLVIVLAILLPIFDMNQMVQ